MADLSIKFAGLNMRSPIWVASQAPPGPVSLAKIIDLYCAYADEGAGAIETHWISSGERTAASYSFETRYLKAKSRPPFGTEGFFVMSPVGKNLGSLSEGLELITALKGRQIGIPIIANTVGPGFDPDGWAALAGKLEAAGADMLELNFSCPMSAGAGKTGGAYVRAEDVDVDGLPTETSVMLGQSEKACAAMVTAVKHTVRVPVICKMTPEVGYPHFLKVAQAMVSSGANGLTAINAPVSIAPPDIYRGGRPRFAGAERYAFGGAYGPWDRFIAYKFIAALARYVPTDISGVGGNVDPEHALEFMMLGAKTVQISSGIIWRGHKVVGRTVRFLDRFLDEQGFRSAREIVGLSQQYIVPLDQVTFSSCRSRVREDLCNGCGICVEGICGALDWKPTDERRVPRVDTNFCVGCGMCVMVCPREALVLDPA